MSSSTTPTSMSAASPTTCLHCCGGRPRSTGSPRLTARGTGRSPGMPTQVIRDMVSNPQMDRRQIFEWSNKLIGFDDTEFQNSREEAQMVSMQMYEYANQLALQRRDSAQDDLVSVLMRAEVDGERLSELEFDLFFLLLAVAGNETTRNLISGGMLALIEHPEERRRLLDDRSLLDTAVEEMLRWVTPVM